MDAFLHIYDQRVNPKLMVRRINISFNHVLPKEKAQLQPTIKQYDLFTNIDDEEQKDAIDQVNLQKEKKVQEAIITIKQKFGKNAVLKGTNYMESATGRKRNKQIGGHKE